MAKSSCGCGKRHRILRDLLRVGWMEWIQAMWSKCGRQILRTLTAPAVLQSSDVFRLDGWNGFKLCGASAADRFYMPRLCCSHVMFFQLPNMPPSLDTRVAKMSHTTKS